MLNPSYLIKSRHGVFYFRYPVQTSRISVSLRTRCPRAALKLAKTLEYHTQDLITRMDFSRMNAKDAKQMLHSHFQDLLARRNARIDEHGVLSPTELADFQNVLAKTQDLVEANVDTIEELYEEEFEAGDTQVDHELRQMLDKRGASLAYDSPVYQELRRAYKYARIGYMEAHLAYNAKAMQFDYNTQPQFQVHTDAPSPIQRGGTHTLGYVLQAYLNEIQSTLTVRSFNDQRGCLDFLTDWLGHNCYLDDIDNAKAQQAKTLLSGTPTNRNKIKSIKGKPLLEQIDITKKLAIATLSHTTINKHLGYFDMFMTWATNNKYAKDNPFKGVRTKSAAKKAKRRDYFNDAEITLILKHLDDNTLVKNKSLYWGALIAIYTGARRGEITSLTPDNVIQDAKSGIWYFDITDEDEDKKVLKTEAAKRTVPVHSALIDLGFLKFIEESKLEGKKRKHKHGLQSRLLYHLTYTENEGWGRNLGRWFNEKYLKALNLKTDKKSLHSLRHSFITHLTAAEGVESGIIKALVGHEDNTVTAQNYTHFGILHLPKFQTAIEKLPY